MEDDVKDIAPDENEVEQPVEPSATEGEEQEEMVPKSVMLKRLKEESEKRRAAEAYVQSLKSQVPSDIKPDEQGNVDPNELVKTAEDRAFNRLINLQNEQKDWEKAERAYPELSEDEDLADAVRGYRLNLLTNRGELISYKDAAEKLLGKINGKASKAREEALEEAQVSETIQKRAGVSAPKEPSGARASLFDKFQSGKLNKDEIRTNWAAIQAEMLRRQA